MIPRLGVSWPRDYAGTETTDHGRPRHKLRGRVFKWRKLSGDEAEWVVLEIVHRAVEVLLELNDGSAAPSLVHARSMTK
ncbi:hypothetical protein [Streptomyces sp. NPDC058280]|uniref:hypothetical protein n=1 Tax=Streptomyces sp. NPDC058280 TaxID=3346419 RepID=UPI0036EC5AEF